MKNKHHIPSFSSGMTTLAEEIMNLLMNTRMIFTKTTESQHTGFEYAKQLGRITDYSKIEFQTKKKCHAEYANISI